MSDEVLNQKTMQTMGMASREKTWDECGIEEKVERLRRELRSQGFGLQRAQRDAANFREHEHNVHGEIVIPLRSKHGGADSEERSRDPLA